MGFFPVCSALVQSTSTVASARKDKNVVFASAPARRWKRGGSGGNVEKLENEWTHDGTIKENKKNNQHVRCQDFPRVVNPDGTTQGWTRLTGRITSGGRTISKLSCATMVMKCVPGAVLRCAVRCSYHLPSLKYNTRVCMRFSRAAITVPFKKILVGKTRDLVCRSLISRASKN